MLGHEPLNRIATERPASYAGEDGIRGFSLVLFKPHGEGRDCVLSQRSAPVLPTLALATHMSSGTEDHILALQADDLRYPQAGLDGHQQECAISPASPSRKVGSRQQRVDLSFVEVVDGFALVAFAGDRQYALAVEGVRGLVEGNVPEEGVDGRQADVPCARSISSLVFQVLQKLAARFRVF